MPDLDHLDQLAPDVDLPKAHDLFDRRRGRRRRTRRASAAGVAAAFLLVVAIGAGTLVADRDSELQVGGTGEPSDAPTTPVPTTPVPTPSTEPAASGDVAFAVVEVRHASEAMGTLRVAADERAFRQLWSDIGFDRAPAIGTMVSTQPPSIDFGTTVVVSITIPDDSCPPTLTSFLREGEVITPVFVEPDGGCDQPLMPKTYLVAIERASVAPRFTLLLPGQETYGFDDQRLVVVDGASAETSPNTVDPPVGDPGAAPASSTTDRELVAVVGLGPQAPVIR